MRPRGRLRRLRGGRVTAALARGAGRTPNARLGIEPRTPRFSGGRDSSHVKVHLQNQTSRADAVSRTGAPRRFTCMTAANRNLQTTRDTSDRCVGRGDRGTRAGGQDEITLAGGATVWVRALEPTDRDALVGLFAR